MPTVNDYFFGTELELFIPPNTTKQQLANAISQRIGKPVQVVESYSHAHVNLSVWKIVSDGSLGDYVRGAEVVAPKLKGVEGFAELAKVCKALQDFGCTVSKTCGYHVHVDFSAGNLAQAKDLVRLYQAYEKVIDAMMPPSRRGSHGGNGFCRTITGLSLDSIKAAHSIGNLAARIGIATSAPPKYHKLNLVPYDRQKTVEFRQHSGTLEANKVVMWAKACIKTVIAAQTGAVPTAPAPATQAFINKARQGSKAWQVGQMLLRPQGASPEEVMAATGWPSVSMPNQARQAGLVVYKVRTGRRVRYYVRRDEVQAPATFIRTLQGWCDVLKLDADEIAYFKERTEGLTGSVEWAA